MIKLDEEKNIPPYRADKEELKILEFTKRRIKEMKDFREKSKIEEEWQEADKEYIPHELDFGSGKKRFEQNQDTGLRSRMVKVGGTEDEWRSDNSAPTLFVKIQTALAIILDNNPEGVFTAISKLYEGRTAIAQAIWKRNWTVADGKENLKKFIFNLFKYGWAIGRSYPRIIKYKKSILKEIDTENPENNKYEEKELVWFNDVAKQNLDPYRTWVDENTKPYDTYSTNDWYFELDYSYDQAEIEFGKYPNWKYVPKDAKVVNDQKVDKSGEEETNDRKDIVTIGFYQNRVKDLNVILVPKVDLVLYSCPIPNDDGLLDLWHTFLYFRTATSPYGIPLWKIIRQNKGLYDKLDNMTMDQLVLSIMKFGFYSGTDPAIGDGIIQIKPGQARKVINGKVDWMEIPGPGKESWDGLKTLESRMDSDTGLSPTLEGDITGKTLGEIQLAREASLKRLKTPLDNIANAIEQDAYLTLSWAKQIYSTPEVKEFASLEELEGYENEVGVRNSGFNTEIDEMGNYNNIQAQYYPELSLNLEINDEGKLIESKDARFFRIGEEINPKDLDWKGIFKVIPSSLVGSSEIINQQTTMQMFNLLVPLYQMPPEIAKKPATQLLKRNQEKPEDWLPDSWLMEQNPMMMQEENPLFIRPEEGQPQGGIPSNGQTMKGKGGVAPNGLQTVVPQGQVPGMQKKEVTGGLGQIFNKLFK